MLDSASVLALGKVGMFTGIETYTWQLSDFQSAANFAKQHAIDFVVVKVFDGPNEWHGGNFQPIHDVFTSTGLQVLPYGYMYGYAKGSDLNSELSLVQKYMRNFGICCGDIETEWNGQTAWGTQVANALVNAPGVFVVSCLADPAVQDQVQVFKNMMPAVSAWEPQIYNDYLQSVWQSQWAQVGKVLITPTYDLSNEFGSNNVVQTAITNSSIVEQITLWEYQFALQNPSLFDSVIKAQKEANMGLPRGAVDTGSTITFPGLSPYIIQLGFYTVYKGLADQNLIPPDDLPLDNEYGANPVEESNPGYWKVPGTAQETRYFRFGYSPAVPPQRTFIGQELVWYRKTYAQQLAQIANLNTEISNLNAQIAQLKQAGQTNVQQAEGAQVQKDEQP